MCQAGGGWRSILLYFSSTNSLCYQSVLSGASIINRPELGTAKIDDFVVLVHLVLFRLFVLVLGQMRKRVLDSKKCW